MVLENFLISNQNEIRILFETLIFFFVSLFILAIFKRVIIKKLKLIAEKTKTRYDDIVVETIEKIGWPFYILISLYISFYYLQSANIGGALVTDAKNIIYYIITILLVYYAIKAISYSIDYGSDLIKKRENIVDANTIDLLNKILKGVLWIIAIILILSNIGYNVSTLIAGLGIGGIAIAFALQSILGDVFASFSIYLDKPFKTGDDIIFEGVEGTVKNIGIKSTRIEALQGQEIVVSNKKLTETILNNYKKMDYRRIAFDFSIKYNTDIKKLEEIPSIIKDIISNIEMTRFGRAHFSKFREGYTFDVVYYVNSRDYETYMDIHQKIILEIIKRFDSENIEIYIPAYLDINTQIKKTSKE